MLASLHEWLSSPRLEEILARIPHLNVGVLGDLFLDRYLDIDPALTEASLETGLDAYQVVRVRNSPGAAGTVINNLVALGVKEICPVSVIGDDGEGYDLSQALRQQGVAGTWLHIDPDRRTPTYTKPMVLEKSGPARELSRLDIKNRAPLPARAEKRVLAALTDLWPLLDALLVVDQVSDEDCGVITERVREELAAMGTARPNAVLLADSRRHIGRFRSVWLKPNRAECLQAAPRPELAESVRELARRTARPVFCTRGEQGMLVVDPRRESAGEFDVPAVPVTGPIDPVGAGDSTSAALACALAAGASLSEAAAFANLAASITIQKLGATGTASPDEIRQRAGLIR
jgi:rfaE bifunctional protein kinase chain/domain